MTTAAFNRRKDTDLILICGHAQYAQPDIVCSAASMLACTLAAALEHKGMFSFEKNDGSVKIQTARSAASDAAVDTVREGFRLLSQKYPENVRLVENGMLWRRPEDEQNS